MSAMNFTSSHKTSKIFTYDLKKERQIIKDIAAVVRKSRDPIAQGIRTVIAHKKPDTEVLIEIKDLINDNWSFMSGILGSKLAMRIKYF